MHYSGCGKLQGSEENVYMRYTAAQRSLEMVGRSDETVGVARDFFFSRPGLITWVQEAHGLGSEAVKTARGDALTRLTAPLAWGRQLLGRKDVT